MTELPPVEFPAFEDVEADLLLIENDDQLEVVYQDIARKARNAIVKQREKIKDQCAEVNNLRNLNTERLVRAMQLSEENVNLYSNIAGIRIELSKYRRGMSDLVCVECGHNADVYCSLCNSSTFEVRKTA